MFLKNYTSDVPVSESIRRIETVLLKCGVTGIMKEYGANQTITAITFRVPDADGRPWMIKLPAKEQEAIDALWMDYVGDDVKYLNKDGLRLGYPSQKKKQRKDFIEQGTRTAWRIVKDWVEVQMSMIQLKQADIMEVFLPYAWDGRRTYYQSLKESNYAGLLRNAGDEASDTIEGELVAS